MSDQNGYAALSLVAFGRATTVGGALVLGFNVGCVLARTGVGVVTITLDPAVGFIDNVNPATALGDGYADVGMFTNGVGQYTLVDTSAQVKTLSMFATAAGAGAAAEGAFAFKLFRRLTR